MRDSINNLFFLIFFRRLSEKLYDSVPIESKKYFGIMTIIRKKQEDLLSARISHGKKLRVEYEKNQSVLKYIETETDYIAQALVGQDAKPAPEHEVLWTYLICTQKIISHMLEQIKIDNESALVFNKLLLIIENEIHRTSDGQFNFKFIEFYTQDIIVRFKEII